MGRATRPMNRAFRDHPEPVGVVVEAERPVGDADAEVARLREAEPTAAVDEHDSRLLLRGDHHREGFDAGAGPVMPHRPGAGIELPAQAVGRRHLAGRAHHQRLALRAQHVVLAVHHHLQVARQVAGAGHDPPLRSRRPVGRGVGQRPLGAEPRQVPGRHALMDLAVGDEAVPHPDRLEDVLCDVGLELLPAHDLDHPAKNLVVRVRVLPLRAGRTRRRDLRELCHPARELIPRAGRVRLRGVALLRGEAARVAEQLTGW